MVFLSLISVVVPCFNEEESLPLYFPAFADVIDRWHNDDSEVNFELILVDDGSSDGTLGIAKSIAGSNKRSFLEVRYISFSRNFGKESAIYAGFQNSRGDYVCTMDADLQDPPDLLPKMYGILTSEDYDSVATRRVDRDGEPPIRSFFARNFYKIINKISDADIVDGARDYRLMSRQMVDSILSMGEYNRFSKGIFGWVGFKTKWLPYVNVQRAAGETHWSFFSLFKYAMSGIVAFSTAPLSIASWIGIVCCVLSLAFTIWIVFKTVLFGDPVGGWPSLACLITLLGGVQLLSIGIIGQYLSRTYLEVKHRPIYIVRESNF